MNRALLQFACAAILMAPSAFAVRPNAGAPPKENKDAAPPKDDSVAPADLPKYVLKHRSAFTNPAPNTRIPFWPVGWSKLKQAAPTATATAEPKFALDEKSFRVTSILVGSGTTPSLAVINGRAYGEGEYLRGPRGSFVRTKVRVERINDGNVTLGYEEQKVQIPLSRPELNQHKGEDEMLDPNR